MRQSDGTVEQLLFDAAELFREGQTLTETIRTAAQRLPRRRQRKAIEEAEERISGIPIEFVGASDAFLPIVPAAIGKTILRAAANGQSGKVLVRLDFKRGTFSPALIRQMEEKRICTLDLFSTYMYRIEQGVVIFLNYRTAYLAIPEDIKILGRYEDGKILYLLPRISLEHRSSTFDPRDRGRTGHWNARLANKR